MSDRQGTCFDANHLSQFLHEQLNEADESSVIDHLDECSACQETLERVAADGSVWSDLREHIGGHNSDDDSASPTTANDQIVESVMEFLGPTDQPDMMGRMGPYEICGIVGCGSTGVVLKAFEQRLNRYVAVKVLAPNFASSGSARMRFEREARAVAAVAHEHVVPIFAVDEFRNLPYLVMQFAGGGSLQQRIDRDGRLEPSEVVRIGMQVASGLAAAHSQGLVHRDVKPANVMLEGRVERAMVTDFGLARVVDEASMTRSGAITGTPQFMSPEQAKGEYVDHRSDLFSLGSLMYTASTGRPPFRSETVYGVIRRVCETDMRPIREINPSSPDWLETFIKKLCAKDREERFQTAAEVRDVLAGELSHMQSPVSVNQPEREWLPNPSASVTGTKTLTISRMILCGFAILVVLLSLVPAIRTALVPRNDRTAEEKSPQRPAFETSGSVEWNSAGLPVFESMMTRALPARQGERLKLAAGKAAVTLMSSEYDQLEIRVVRKVATATRDAARELFSDHALNVSFDDLGIVIESGIDTEPDLQQSFGEFAIEVYLPKNYSANVTTIGGAVSAAQVAGDLKCETNGGFVSVGTVDGNATIDSGKGRVKLAHVRGDLSLTSTLGDAIVSKLDGAATVKSLSGDIDVVFTAQPSRQSVLRTASGDIAISLLDRLGFNLEASTEQGSITAPFVSETKNSKRIVSTLNDGGPRLVVESEEGNVFIRQFPVTTDGKRKTDHNKGKAKFHPSDNWISSVCQQNHHLTE